MPNFVENPIWLSSLDEMLRMIEEDHENLDRMYYYGMHSSLYERPDVVEMVRGREERDGIIGEEERSRRADEERRRIEESRIWLSSLDEMLRMIEENHADLDRMGYYGMRSSSFSYPGIVKMVREAEERDGIISEDERRRRIAERGERAAREREKFRIHVGENEFYISVTNANRRLGGPDRFVRTPPKTEEERILEVAVHWLSNIHSLMFRSYYQQQDGSLVPYLCRLAEVGEEELRVPPRNEESNSLLQKLHDLIPYTRTDALTDEEEKRIDTITARLHQMMITNAPAKLPPLPQ